MTTTPEQDRQLIKHAAARNLATPEEALQALLDTALPAKKRWTEWELELLRNPKNSPRDIAKRTGRSVQSVSVRRHKLARDENLPELMRQQRA